MTDQGEGHLNSSVLSLHQNEEKFLAPGLIAALTMGSMFVFYFALMMIVCLGEWYQYTHGKKGRSINLSSNSSSASNSRSQNRRSRHFSYTDGSTSQSDHRASSFASHSEDQSVSNRPGSSNRNEDNIAQYEETVCIHKTVDGVRVCQNEVGVNIHENEGHLHAREDEMYVHVKHSVCNETDDIGAASFVKTGDYTETSDSSCVIEPDHSTLLPLLPKFKHSSNTVEADESTCS